MATFDSALSATVTSRSPLVYEEGPDPAEDRPAHVRAGSGIAWVGSRLAIVSDDSLFVSLVSPDASRVTALALPRGPGGLRLFDDGRGNKQEKLDLESCCVFEDDGAPCLLAFGSGSTRARERIVRVRFPPEGAPEVRVIDARAFYEALRSRADFSGSELNVEGVALSGEDLRLFQRGNGESRGGSLPVNATATVSFPELAAFLAGEANPPALRDVTPYDLGTLSGTRLTFTDGATAPRGGALYLASAEASPDTYRDGPVAGSVVGVLGEDGVARQTVLRDGSGAPFPEKAEGLVLVPGDPTAAFVVVDADDPGRPSLLCEVRLAGPWF
ncbi:MAG TPA: hypothetical protein VHE30_18620 [Polyangiaceae bacterium]|nr:hypothetical protein [Polyangiaceae bacterium]